MFSAVGVAVSFMFATVSCEHQADGSERQLLATVDSFATVYFNCQYHLAEKFCTPESRQWISYAASQLTQDDIDLINQQEERATIELGDVAYDGDTAAFVNLSVHNYLKMDTIGGKPHMAKEDDYRLLVVKQDGQKRWKVSLKTMPRVEK